MVASQRILATEEVAEEVIDLNVTNPVLTLLPAGNRVGTELDVAAVDRLFGNTATAHVKLDYGLRFQASDHTIRMTGVRVRELTLASGSSNLRGAAQRIGGLVAENALEDLVLYRMKPAQADEMDRLNLVASPITVTPQGLHMTVSPAAGLIRGVRRVRQAGRPASPRAAYHRALMQTRAAGGLTERRAWIRCC